MVQIWLHKAEFHGNYPQMWGEVSPNYDIIWYPLSFSNLKARQSGDSYLNPFTKKTQSTSNNFWVLKSTIYNISVDFHPIPASLEYALWQSCKPLLHEYCLSYLTMIPPCSLKLHRVYHHFPWNSMNSLRYFWCDLHFQKIITNSPCQKTCCFHESDMQFPSYFHG